MTRPDPYADAPHGSSPPEEAPRSRALTLVFALVIGLIGVLGGGYLFVFRPALAQARARAERTQCANNLRQIALAAVQYADDKRTFPYEDGDFQQTLVTLQTAGYLDVQLRCPSAGGGPCYDGFKAPFRNNTRSTTLIVWDLSPHLGPKGIALFNVVYADCTVEAITEARLTELLADLEAQAAKVRAARAEAEGPPTREPETFRPR